MTVPAVPDLDTIRQRCEASVEDLRRHLTGAERGVERAADWYNRTGHPNDAEALAKAKQWLTVWQGRCDEAGQLVAVLDALESAQARLVAVEAERDTLAAKIEAVRAAHDRECYYNRYACPFLPLLQLSVVPGEREREE